VTVSILSLTHYVCVHVGVSLFTFTLSVCPVGALCLFLFSIVMFDELLASLAAVAASLFTVFLRFIVFCLLHGDK